MTTPAVALIGPNSVLQTLRALDELEPAEVKPILEAAKGVPHPIPPGMIPEVYFVELVAAVRARLDSPRAEAVLRRSGLYTAQYVAKHRIPGAVRLALSAAWPGLGIPLLLSAFRAHAWTFAGAGRFEARGQVLTLDGSPTCRPAARPSGPGGAYYEAAFEGLLSLTAPRVRVREVSCAATGAPRCTFHVFSNGEPTCAS